MVELVTFHFPLPENRGNRRGHSRWEWVGKNKFYEGATLMNLAIIGSFRRKYPIQPEKWFWKSHAIVKRCLDFDNLVAMHKHPLDWLRLQGIICQDSPKWFWPLELPTQESNPKKQTGLAITLYGGDK